MKIILKVSFFSIRFLVTFNRGATKSYILQAISLKHSPSLVSHRYPRDSLLHCQTCTREEVLSILMSCVTIIKLNTRNNWLAKKYIEITINWSHTFALKSRYSLRVAWYIAFETFPPPLRILSSPTSRACHLRHIVSHNYRNVPTNAFILF